MTWRAFHLFYFDEEHADPLIVEADRLVRTLAADAGRWFFIRYNIGGMHLRFRLRDNPAGFDEVALRLRGEAWTLAEAPLAHSSVPPGGVPDEREHFHYPGSAVEIPYVPETERYGGPDALPENEALFALSTSIAVQVIGATLGDRPKRAKLAIDLMLAAATVAVADEARLAGYFEAYSRFWGRQYFEADEVPEGSRATNIEAVEVRLRRLRDFARSDASPGTPSHYWVRALAQARRTFEELAAAGKLAAPADGAIVTDGEACEAAVSDMLMSQTHMMNNRLGFSPYVEMMWAGALARSLAR
ncbi:MAG TPA: lantibiotic dehydratase C-terminal domain-containing protein [Allosphingosinicella sp.]|nr:lantibiotic dehydratase C-terminal domain-containing protein [Allosphingosinicella sp.]